MSMFGEMIDRIFTKGADAVRMAPGAGVINPTPDVPLAPTPDAHDTKVAAMTPAETHETLRELAARKDEDLNWDTSIVDLLKLLDMDSSRDARLRLADELGYTGDRTDSATMNIWLHKTVMLKFSEHTLKH